MLFLLACLPQVPRRLPARSLHRVWSPEGSPVRRPPIRCCGRRSFCCGMLLAARGTHDESCPLWATGLPPSVERAKSDAQAAVQKVLSTGVPKPGLSPDGTVLPAGPMGGSAAGWAICTSGLIRRCRRLLGFHQELHTLSASPLQAAERGSSIKSCAFRTLGHRPCRTAQGCSGRSACEAAARPAEEGDRGKGGLAGGRQEGAALGGAGPR